MATGWVIFTLVCLWFPLRAYIVWRSGQDQEPRTVQCRGPKPPPPKLPPLAGNWWQRRVIRKLF